MKRNPIFHGIMDQAQAAGREAGEACRPVPMAVVAGDIFGKPLPGAEVEVVEDGVCGFAWVSIKGNTKFGRWASQQGLTLKDYPSGLLIRLEGNYNQSMQRKEAHARAMVKVLREHGIDCYVKSRMD